jgi:hypothetical protein
MELELDTESKTVIVDGEIIKTTPLEYRILELYARIQIGFFLLKRYITCMDRGCFYK